MPRIAAAKSARPGCASNWRRWVLSEFTAKIRLLSPSTSENTNWESSADQLSVSSEIVRALNFSGIAAVDIGNPEFLASRLRGSDVG